jgi:membrane protease YdiL (CAAX protease family)
MHRLGAKGLSCGRIREYNAATTRQDLSGSTGDAPLSAFSLVRPSHRHASRLLNVTLIRQFFWNSSENRLRAPFRILLYFFLWILISRVLDWILIPPLSSLWVSFGLGNVNWFEHGVHFVLYFVVVVGVTFFVAHTVDKRSARQLGMQLDRGWWLELAAGLALGAILMSAIFVLVWMLGWIEVSNLFAVLAPDDIPFGVAFAGAFIVFIIIGVTEELMFRGYVLRNCAEGMHAVGIAPRTAVVGAWLLSSALFGFFHILNPGATPASTINLMLAGMMLGLPMVLTARLGMPIGLHIAWNFVQGNIYGFPVSGNDFSRVTVFETLIRGPELWTGGLFGPEAGVLGLLAILAGSGMIIWWLGRTGARSVVEHIAIYRPRSQSIE